MSSGDESGETDADSCSCQAPVLVTCTYRRIWSSVNFEGSIWQEGRNSGKGRDRVSEIIGSLKAFHILKLVNLDY
jgi:hypothetical protein